MEADSFRKLVSPRYAVQLGTRLPDLGLLASGTFRLETEIFSKRALPLGILASLVWFIILSKLGGVDRLRSPVLLLFGLALIAGCLSVPLTRVFIVWQEEVFGFVQNGELVNDLIYCISGIGLREELAKIILFLPFVPFIAKRRTTLEILIAAGCVGLGFATVENIGYFDSAGPKEAFPRMVSAAFLHISLTGLLGLALCRFYHYPKRCWEEMVATFVAVVLIHGVYDAFILVPQLSDQFDIFSFLILVLTIKYYFKKIGEARGSLRHDVSPLGVFVIGISLVVGAAWIFALRYYSLDYALEGVGKGFFVSGVLAFVYINEFRHE
ncbi:MAG: RsiW-degrading membrane proteinase PrsW (M82 family) [Verrucomicrobiales bacterium]